MELKLEGRIKLINETQTWDSGFSKREFVKSTIPIILFSIVKGICGIAPFIKPSFQSSLDM